MKNISTRIFEKVVDENLGVFRGLTPNEGFYCHSRKHPFLKFSVDIFNRQYKNRRLGNQRSGILTCLLCTPLEDYL